MKPVIYQIFPRYWGSYVSRNVRGGSLSENRCGHFGDFDDATFEYIRSLGCTHLWYTGIIRHATSERICGCTPSHPQFVKGKAGSPYAITDYKDVNPYLASDPDRRMEEFESLVQRTHDHGLKVIIDFVPNHVSRDNVNFGHNDDTSVHWAPENDFFYYPGEELTLPGEFVPSDEFPKPYAEFPARATGNNCFSPNPGSNDWYETVKLNYCDFHTGTWDKMLDILKFWLDKGVDGFRCDMVELVPSEFFAWVIAKVKEINPRIIFIAEVYSKESYRHYLREVGFDYLYDKSGLYDSLRDIVAKNVNDDWTPAELWQSTRLITANWQFLADMQPQMLNFLENHDEVRIASEEFARCASNCFAALGTSALLNTAPFMIYSGQEVGENAPESEGFSGHDGRSTIFDWWKSRSAESLWEYVHSGTGLDVQQQSTLDKYREIMQFANTNQVSEGETFDLCFCNMTSEGFDPDKHFAFLRFDTAACWLIVCNFSNTDAAMTLDIPTENMRRTVQVNAFDTKIERIR